MSKAAIKIAACAAAVSLISAGHAGAGTISYNVSGPGIEDAENAQQTFLNGLHSGTELHEDFEGYDAPEQRMSFFTDVGEFSVHNDFKGSGASCQEGNLSCDAGLAVLNDSSYGRFPLPEGESTQFLDSMDYQKVDFELDQANNANAVGFFMTDPNDQGGAMSVELSDGSVISELFEDILGGRQGSDSAFYLSFYAEAGIESLSFQVNDLEQANPNDGFSVDNVTTGRVPEPGTLALLGLGLVGLAVARRRDDRQEHVAA